LLRPLLLLLLAPGGAARAAPIVFTHSGIGSETIGVTAITDAGFTITAFADTDDRCPPNPGNSSFSTVHSAASISIEGIGSFQFITPTLTYVDGNGGFVGFSR
jgi:hypothetical protein